VSSINTHSSRTIRELIESLFGIWRQIVHMGGRSDLPLFNGVLPLSPKLDATRTDNHSQTSLPISEPLALLIWETLISNKPVIILGTNARTTSQIVRFFGDICLDGRHVLPYVSAFDPRFPKIMAHPKGIIGVCNPIAKTMARKGVRIFRIGGKTGRPHIDCNKLKAMTEKVVSIVKEGLAHMVRKSPGKLKDGMISVHALKDCLKKSGLVVRSGADEFSSNLIAGRIMKREYKKIIGRSPL
jgi:hypothetical protein